MKLLLYLSKRKNEDRLLRNAVMRIVPASQQEVCFSFENLWRKLHQPLNAVEIAVISAGSRAELLRLMSLSELLSDLRVILVLPDRQKETIAMGLTLLPSYYCFADCNMSELGAVLNKMIGASCGRSLQGGSISDKAGLL